MLDHTKGHLHLCHMQFALSNLLCHTHTKTRVHHPFFGLCHVCLLAACDWSSVAVSLVCASVFTRLVPCTSFRLSLLWLVGYSELVPGLMCHHSFHHPLLLCHTIVSGSSTLPYSHTITYTYIPVCAHTCSHTSTPCKSPHSLLLTYVTCPLPTCHWIRKLWLTGALL